MQQKAFYLGLSLTVFLALVGTGCASTQKTTTTQTSAQYPHSNEVGAVSDQPHTTVVEKSETTTTDTNYKQVGVVGAAFHVIGTIIAFPFVVIGKFLQMIF